MNLRYIDIHSHLNLKPLSENSEVILAKMREEGIGTITVGTSMEKSKKAVAIAEEHPDLCWATVGIHPTDADEVFDAAFFEEIVRHPKVVAIGETGLDYFRDQSDSTKEKQVMLFKQHIALARAVDKPLMLHVRASKDSDDAYYDALEILKNEEGVVVIPDQVRNDNTNAKLRANFHFFSGSKGCMEAIVSAGYTISVDGPITFSHDYDDMIRACPIESLMVETDAPYAAPVPYRGKTCEPWMVVEVVKKIAELKDMDEESVRLQMLENTQNFFGI